MTLDKEKAKNIVIGWFHYFENCCNGIEEISAESLGKFLSTDFHITSNGQLICKSLSEYLGRMHKFHQYYVYAKLCPFLEEPLVCDNKLVVHYAVDLTARGGQNSQMVFMAIASFADDKISNWIQVAHQKGTGHWESLNP